MMNLSCHGQAFHVILRVVIVVEDFLEDFFCEALR